MNVHILPPIIGYIIVQSHSYRPLVCVRSVQGQAAPHHTTWRHKRAGYPLLASGVVPTTSCLRHIPRHPHSVQSCWSPSQCGTHRHYDWHAQIVHQCRWHVELE